MNITRLPLVVVFLFGPALLLAQTLPHSPNVIKNGTREGQWTVWLNVDWRPTTNKDSVEFYRRISYVAGKPIGMVSDHFRNGKLQWQGHLITDQPVDKIEGTAMWYRDDGSKMEEARFVDGIKQESKIFHPDGKLDTLGTLDAQAIVYFDLGQFQKAVECFSRVLPVIRKLAGPEHPEYAVYLNNMATMQMNAGNLKEAEACLLEVRRIRQKVLGEHDPAYSSSLNNLSVLYDEMGEYDKAEKYLRESLIIRKADGGTETMSYAITMNNMGMLYRRLNRLEEAEEALRESLRIRRINNKQHEADYANTLSNLGGLLEDMGKPEKAEPVLLESLDIFKSTVGDEHPDYANTLNNLANVYIGVGRLDKAETVFLEALRIRKATLGEDHYYYAVSLNNLAYLYKEQKRYALAESFHLQSLAIRRKNLGPDHPECANSLNNLGMLYHMTDRYSKAEKVFAETLEIRGKKFGTHHPFYLTTKNNIAKLRQSEQRYAESETMFMQNLDTLEAIRNTDGYLYLTTLFNLAALNQETGNQEKAGVYFHKALEKLTNQIDRYFLAFSEEEKEKFYKTETENFTNYNAYCLKRYAGHPPIAGDMFTLQLFTKGLLLNSQTKWKERILHSGDTALLTVYDTWVMKQGQIARLYNTDDSANQLTTQRLVDETQLLEKNLTQRSELFTKLADKKRYTWKDVQRQLRPGEAAIEMIRCQKYGVARMITDTSDVNHPVYPRYYTTDTVHYAALIITATSVQPRLVLLGNGALLETRYLRYYRNCISSRVRDELSYAQFWKPIADALGKKIKKVYFSPDGVYNSINLATLYHPDAKRYLLDEIDIQRVTSTRDLPAMTVASPANNVALIVGHPDYNVNTDTTAVAHHQQLSTLPAESTALTDLPGTQREVEQIGSLLKQNSWQSEVRTGNSALEENIKSIFKPRVLHIATHGYFEPDADHTTNINPLLQSGLMLAGANRTLQGYTDEINDDGILTAYEAMNLNLDNTDLVVLSACETGLGEVRNGEGVYGLQRAFTVAGARTVIMSMWKVNDDATQSLLTLFYQYWLTGKNKSQALKEAQRTIKKKYPEPYYWGAFVIVGSQ